MKKYNFVMVYTPLFELPPFSLLQELFKYASPILVGMESMKCRRSRIPDKISHWLKVVETTRILLAHASIELNGQKQLLEMIAANMVNLYRLFGLDLHEKEAWVDIHDEHIYFVEPNEKGKIGINLNSMESILSCLKKEEAIGMQDEFHLINDDTDVKHIFGHCLYILVATRDGKWRDKCSIYKDLQKVSIS